MTAMKRVKTRSERRCNDDKGALRGALITRAERSCGAVLDGRHWSDTPISRERISQGAVEPGDFDGKRADMNGIIYLVGLVVVVLAILSFLGLR